MPVVKSCKYNKRRVIYRCKSCAYVNTREYKEEGKVLGIQLTRLKAYLFYTYTTVEANSSSRIDIIDVETFIFAIHLIIVVTLLRMTETLTLFTDTCNCTHR